MVSIKGGKIWINSVGTADAWQDMSMIDFKTVQHRLELKEAISFPDFTTTMHGTYTMDEEAMANLKAWRNQLQMQEQIRDAHMAGLHSLWTRVSFRALVIGSNLFQGDEWPPINQWGALPYTNFESVNMARDMYRKRGVVGTNYDKALNARELEHAMYDAWGKINDGSWR